MKLYLINGSPNGRKVLSVVRHLGLTPELIWLDIFAGDTQTEEYLKLNPNGLSPTLVDNEVVLWESNAINTYLCETTTNQSLLPVHAAGKAEVLKWLCWELAHFNKALGVIAFQTVAKPSFGLGETNQAIVDFYTEEFNRYGPVLEKHLEDREFIVGDDWTLADYALGHVEMFQPAMPIEWERFPNIVHFYDRIRGNAHWALTQAAPDEIGRKPAD
ncbi:glutathione S-transferase family protein [Neptuniibacter sp. QD37_6]|uniref:glutathione S-transferase family protein n=1 Tax=Neptuniibacter sp. QD37_6 TaxID=3398210 RepID=UPI0039F5188A